MPEPTGSLLEAMLAVQAEAPPLPKNATNPHYKSKYTKLDTIVEKIGPLLAKHKLVWSTLPSYSDVGPTLKYELSHAPSGEAKTGEMPLLLSKQDAQGQGSAITYARRYAICAVLNLVADDDDDGARAAAARAHTASGGSGDEATAPQKKLLRQLVTQNRLDADAMTRLLARVGLELSEGEKVNDAINRLRKHQCSRLIETIKDGAIPVGGSDVPPPADEDFKHPPSGDDSDIPFSPEAPQ